MSATKPLTARRRAKCIDAFRETGKIASVAQAVGVCQMTLRKWRREDATLQAELDEAYEAYVERVAHKAVTALERHLDSVLAGERHPDKYGIVQKTGERVLLQHGEKIPLNVALCRTALTRYDARWVRPPQDDERTDPLSLALAEVAKALATPGVVPTPPIDVTGVPSNGALASPSLPT